MQADINVEISFSATAKLSGSDAKKVVKKWTEGKNDLSFNVNLGLGDGFTGFGNDDVVSGELSVAADASGKSVTISFSGVVGLCDNHMKTVVPYFSKGGNVVTATSVDLTIAKNDSIEASHEFEFECPVTWSLAGEALSGIATATGSRRPISGTLSIARSRLSRIENDELCAEDPDQVSEALKGAPKLLDAIKAGKSKISAFWDMDSAIVGNVQVTKVTAGLVTSSTVPVLKNVEVKFTCEADHNATDDDIASEIENGLMPMLEKGGTKFTFFNCDELECRID